MIHERVEIAHYYYYSSSLWPTISRSVLNILSSLLSPKLLILTLLPLPFAWHLPIDKKGVLFSIEVVKKRMPRSQLGVNIQCLARYTTAKPLRTAPEVSESYPSASSMPSAAMPRPLA